MRNYKQLFTDWPDALSVIKDEFGNERFVFIGSRYTKSIRVYHNGVKIALVPKDQIDTFISLLKLVSSDQPLINQTLAMSNN